MRLRAPSGILANQLPVRRYAASQNPRIIPSLQGHSYPTASSSIRLVHTSSTALARKLVSPPLPKVITEEKKTLLMLDWEAKKREYPDAILMYQLGGFYELLREDADYCAKALDIHLTKRGEYALAGFPCEQLAERVNKLVLTGRKVAIINQFAKEEKGKVMPRRLVRLVTPGTLLNEGEMLQPMQNNYLVAAFGISWDVRNEASSIGLAWVDVSTNECGVNVTTPKRFADELERLDPRELLLAKSVVESSPPLLDFLLRTGSTGGSSCTVTSVPDETFQAPAASLFDKESTSVEEVGFMEGKCLGALRSYVTSNFKEDATSEWSFDFARMSRSRKAEILDIDSATFASLEVIRRNKFDAEESPHRIAYLTDVVDETTTGPGSRLLRAQLRSPLTDPDAINRRLDAAEWFYRNEDTLSSVRQAIQALPDASRAFQRLCLTSMMVESDISTVARALSAARAVGQLISSSPLKDDLPLELKTSCDKLLGTFEVRTNRAMFDRSNDAFSRLRASSAKTNDHEMLKFIDDKRQWHPNTLTELIEELTAALKILQDPNGVVEELLPSEDSSSQTIFDTSCFAKGYCAPLDARRKLVGGQTKEELEEEFKRETGATKGLKLITMQFPRRIGINRDKATLVELPLSGQLDLELHPSYELVQKLTSRIRYYTPKLRALDKAFDNQRQSLQDIEDSLLSYLRWRIVGLREAVVESLEALAKVDVFATNAHVAHKKGLVRPIVNDSKRLIIQAGRHLVGESALGRGGDFQTNDLSLDDSATVSLLTAPNASGKSTYLKQCALIALTAQAGMFVPAKSAEIGIVDRMFSRIGARDEIYNHRSTFMIEMDETATMLNNATPRSFVVVDEVGRGTSPEEGLAIAWSTLERLEAIQARCLFATHFHRLTKEKFSDKLRCFTMDVRVDEDNRPLFTYRVVPGSSKGGSYALHVAELAGMPVDVLRRAEELMVRVNDEVKS